MEDRFARVMAEKDNILINQMITLALAEKLSALMTEEYLESRAKRASRAKFEVAMAQVADVEPGEDDRL
jgi:hypothetical protein